VKEDIGARDAVQVDGRAARRRRARRTGRRRRWVLAATGLVLAGSAAAGGLALDRDPAPDADPVPGAGPAALPAATTALPVPTTTVPPPPQLPRGGRRLFPRYRVVGFYGMQNLDVPTPSGRYRTHQEDAIVRSFLEAVRRIDGMLVLDVQPGRDDFLSSVRHWEPYLRQPDVGIALDPEFAMGPGQVPGKHLGRTDAAAINRASAYVAGIVRRHRLPQKLFMVHQFHDSMIRDKARIAIRPGLAMTWNADGFGVRKAKLDDYRSYTRDRRFHPGLKLFYENDVDLMSPREVMKLKPVPRVINYQ